MYQSKNLYFENEQGLKLAATLELPKHNKPKAYAIFAHCFGCNKDMLATSRISRALTEEGFAVLRFDFTGLGSSHGNFEETNFSTNVSDIVSAAKFLRDQYQAPTLLIGHSLGGAAVIAASNQIPEIKAIATIGTPSYPSHVNKHFHEHIEKLDKNDSVTIKIAEKELKITKQFLEDIEKHNLEEILKNSNCSIIIFHSPIDKIVNIDQASKLYKAAKHPKSFVSLDKADHMLSNPEDAKFVSKIIAIWANRYILE